MTTAAYLAVDLGAGSGRAMLGCFNGEGARLEELRRFQYAPRERDGHLRWDLTQIFHELSESLVAARVRCLERGATLVSVGVDSWGVDYGLVDAQGTLLEDPICYRDRRTEGALAEIERIVPRAEIFARTGIQFLPFNTLLQLHAHRAAGWPIGAAQMLMIPDLCHAFLSGRRTGEYTNASTTQMLSLTTKGWDLELITRVGLPAELLPPLVLPGTDLGPLQPQLAVATGLPGVRVVVPATHDTASAVAGTPLRPGWAYISSGTWSLVGVERTRALAGPDSAQANFTNEGGVAGTVRFLKNVMGLWILDNCHKEWAQAGQDVPHAELTARVTARGGPIVVIDPDDERFLAPRSMLAALRAGLAERSQNVGDEPVAVAKLVLDSLAWRYAQVVERIEALTDEPVRGIHIVGGGSLNDYLNQATADASGRPVLAGPVEATALGNLALQAITHGRFANLAAARARLADDTACRSFVPRKGTGWDRGFAPPRPREGERVGVRGRAPLERSQS